MKQIGLDLLEFWNEEDPHERLKIYAINLLRNLGCKEMFSEYGIPMYLFNPTDEFERRLTFIDVVGINYIHPRGYPKGFTYEFIAVECGSHSIFDKDPISWSKIFHKMYRIPKKSVLLIWDREEEKWVLVND